MARDLRIKIEGDSKSGRKALDDVADEADKAALTMKALGAEFKAAARDGDKLEGGLAKTGGAAKKASESITVLGRQTDKAAEEFRAAARAAEKFDASLAATRVEITRLNKAYGETGDAKVLQELQKQYGEFDRIARLRQRTNKDAAVERKAATAFAEAAKHEAARLAAQNKRGGRGVFRNTLADLFGLGKGALGLGTSIASGASTSLNTVTGSVPGGTPAVIGGLGAAVAPVAGGAAGGALLAGAGLLGVGAGIGGAIANNPEPFQKAWTVAIADVSRRWQDASTGFEKPALDAFATIKNSIDAIDIEGPLKEAEKFVQPLALGIGGFITEFGNGLGDLIKHAGPVITVLEKDLPVLGKSFAEAFKQIGGSSGEAAVAFDDVLQFVGQSIIAVGILISTLSKAYVAVKDFGMGVASLGGLIHVFDQAPVVMTYGRALDSAKVSTHGLVSEERYLAEAVKKATDELAAQTGNLLALDAANDAAATAADKLKESFRQNGSAIDGNSKAALANRAVLQQVIGTYEQQRDAAIKAGDQSVVATGKANAAYRKELEDLRAILVAHGDNTSAVDKYLAELDHLDGTNVSVNIVTRHIDQYLPSGVSLGALTHRARGGTSEGGPTVVGEHGPEVRWLSRGDYISTAEQTRSLVSQMSQGGGGGGGSGGDLTIGVAAGAEGAVGQLMQHLFQRGLVQLYDSTGTPVRTRR